jgi:hypothetical protein
LFWFFFSILGFEPQASCLLDKCSTAWATLPALFFVGYFWDRI